MTLRIAVENPILRRRLYEDVEMRLEAEITSGRVRAGDAIPSERT